ncbi:hypothetical protein BLS_009651 [Venturia inaequalis]|uniref:Wax synthase domain-containing protein n=1 Tax=Venturia inaequalis TaxID=5025 RepID=A0A8H3VAN2_VENIN|nr:hypothetical protein EG328_009615 [Venturia inaequalis]KAE9985173.1 hypothetical protein BLS_009651 [Venturia inaequalis]KAE9993198.1 hypothetical protein EG327_005999 [Venturia inaequalis]
MFPALHPTHRERIKQLDAQYDHHTNQGHYLPFVYPWGSLGTFLVIAYLLVPHSKSAALRDARYAVWAINTVFAAYIMLHTRGRGAVAAYGVGFAMAWSIVWTTIMLVVHDGQVDFARIERASGSTGRVRQEERRQEGYDSLKSGQDDHESALRHRPTKQSNVKSRSPGNVDIDPTRGSELIWQHYPHHPFLERLDWVLDLMANFRGMAWNWRITSLPSPPKEVVEQLSKHDDPRNSKINHSKSVKPHHIFPSRDVLLRSSLRRFIVGYLALDLIKILIIHDPFFWTGDPNLPGPSYLPTRLSTSLIFMKSQRLLIAQLAVYWALQTIFQTAPLFFVGILGSERIGVRGQHWMYPPEWGNYSAVLNRGLSGWWGIWWHQSFRFAFESPGKKLVSLLDLDPTCLTTKTLQMFVAFSISGFLHANASYTSIGNTRPVRGPFLFFFLQPFGIIAQMVASKLFRAMGITQYIPMPVRQAVSFLYVHIWFYHTAPLFVEDVAAGGQLLYEPIPFSILRALGFGTEENSWYCWGGRWPGFHRGRHWWESGIGT